MSKAQIIITGVSSGIGHAIAKAALDMDYKVQGIGRNEPVDLIGRAGWSYFHADLSRPEVVDTIPFMHPNIAGPKILINNAGVLGPVMYSKNAQWREIDKTTTVNVVAPMRLSARFLSEVPGEKQIYFTGSGAAEFAIPGWSAYCASKAAIHMYAQVLQQENPDVRIHAFKPGKVDTPMQEQIRSSQPTDFPAVEAFREDYEQGKLVSPETVATKLLKVIEGPGDQEVVFALSEITL